MGRWSLAMLRYLLVMTLVHSGEALFRLAIRIAGRGWFEIDLEGHG